MEGKKKLSFPLLLIILIVVIVGLVIFGVKTYYDNQIKNQPTSPNQFTLNDVDYDKENFAFTFLQMENNKKNMVYSPLSIKYALNMLNEGASGNTKLQIENIIKDLELTNYKDIDKVLSLANSVFIRNNFSNSVENNFINTLTEKYSAEVRYDSFENASSINNWIENKTFGRIKNMISDEMVQDPLTVMVLVNALAIDMGWQHPFDNSDTYKDEFYLENGEKKLVETMHDNITSSTASYYKDKNITALTMDLMKYQDTQMEFMAIMPNENLYEYINNFSLIQLEDIISKLKPASYEKGGIDVSIPKFSFEYDLSLKEDLKKLGIQDAFAEGVANFSNMAKERLFVKEALHKANIEFKENGIKAAAATALMMNMESMIIAPKEPLEVTIDKPFIFVIKDKNTSEIWFVGAMYEPVWEEE